MGEKYTRPDRTAVRGLSLKYNRHIKEKQTWHGDLDNIIAWKIHKFEISNAQEGQNSSFSQLNFLHQTGLLSHIDSTTLKASL